MTERDAQTVIHHIEQAARRAGVKFDADCRAELVAVFEAEEQRIARIEAAIARLDDLTSLLPDPEYRDASGNRRLRP
jgi:hypothetical protein